MEDSTPPSSAKRSREIKSNSCTEALNKKREAVEEKEGQRYQPQEAVFIAPV